MIDPLLSAVGTFKVAVVSVLAILALLLALLETILRKSEKLNLVACLENSSKDSKDSNANAVDIELALARLTEIHGHVNSLHAGLVTFESTKVNFIKGWRLTTDQPTNPTSNLYLFGGSTIQCLEVVDKNTICSHLQRHLNLNSLSIRVHNRGVSGMTVGANQTELSKTKISSGDIVVVYFGANDSKLDTYSQEAIFPFRIIPGYIKILGGLRIKFKLRVAEWLWLETIRPASRTRENAVINAKNVETLLSQMSEQTVIAGARFIALLQPNIFTKKTYTSRDLEIHNRSKINPKIVKLQYNEYIKALGRKQWFYPVTNALDEHFGSAYLDWCHLDSSGNDLVASRISKIVKGDQSENIVK